MVFQKLVALIMIINKTVINRHLKLIWGSLLYGQYKVQATNSFCVPLLCYGFGIAEWTKAEMAQFDVSVCRLMTSTSSLIY